MTPTSNASQSPHGEGPVREESPNLPFDIGVQELKRRRDAGEPLVLLDVREPEEFRLANIGGELIPFGVLPVRMHEMDRRKEIIVLCHHGNRSWLATDFLRRNGFALARNLVGGIESWSRLIDPTVPRY